MNWTIEKAKIAKGQSYVLKTSELQKLLAEAGINCAVHLIYHSSPQHQAITLVDCQYWLPNNRVPYERFYISTTSVAFENRKVADELLKDQVLPALVKWMREIVEEPDNSTSIRHDMVFRARLVHDQLSIIIH